jgi:hypothetical protein
MAEYIRRPKLAIDKQVKDGAKERKLKQGASLQLKKLILTSRTAKI